MSKKEDLSYFDHSGKIQRRIIKLNKEYYGPEFNISIKTEGFHFQKRVSLCIESKEIGNFFFYPTHRILEYDGDKTKQYGYRICCFKYEFDAGSFKPVIKRVSLDISNDEVKNGKWKERKKLSGFELKKGSSDKILRLMEKMCKGTRKEVVVSSVPGWVKSNQGFHHIPISKSKPKVIMPSENILKAFRFEVSEDMDAIEAYKKIKELLSVTEKEISIPLLSYTVISSLQSLIKSYEPFMLSICSKNARKAKMLANLFCNLYNRTAHLYELDLKLYSNNDFKDTILEKSKRFRDAVFISTIEKRSDLKTYMKVQKETPCGVLLITSSLLRHDSVIDISIEGTSIDTNIPSFHGDHPDVFSTALHYFIRYIEKQRIIAGWNKDINKLFNSCKKAIEGYSHTEFNPNKLEQFAWLLMGYKLLGIFGKEIGAITEAEFNSSLNEAVAIFHSLSAIEIGELQTTTEISEMELEAVKFLGTVDKVLTFGGFKKREENTADPKWGWYDDEKLYLRNNEIFNLAKNDLKSKKGDIYEFLCEKEIIIDRPKLGSGWGNQFNSRTKVIHYHIQNMKTFLKDHGHELNFLNHFQ